MGKNNGNLGFQLCKPKHPASGNWLGSFQEPPGTLSMTVSTCMVGYTSHLMSSWILLEQKFGPSAVHTLAVWRGHRTQAIESNKLTEGKATQLWEGSTAQHPCSIGPESKDLWSVHRMRTWKRTVMSASRGFQFWTMSSANHDSNGTISHRTE